MQRLPHSLLQEIQQQREKQIEGGSGGARSQNTSATPPFQPSSQLFASKSSLESPTPSTAISNDSKPLSISFKPVQQRITTDRAGESHGTESSTISTSTHERSSSRSRKSRETWRPSSTKTIPSQLMGGSAEGSMKNGFGGLSMRFTSTPEAQTPDPILEESSSSSSGSSRVSSIAYVVQDRRRDLRMFSALGLPKFRPNTPAKERPAPPTSLRSSMKPTIVEDSRDYITARKSLASHSSLTRQLESDIESPVHTPLSTSSQTLSSSVQHQRRSESEHSNRRSPLTSDSSSTIMSSNLSMLSRRPALMRAYASDNTTPPLARTTTILASTAAVSAPLTDSTIRLEQHRTTSWSVMSEIDIRKESVLDTQTLPTFQPDEQYFETMSVKQQKEFTPESTPDLPQEPEVLVDGKPNPVPLPQEPLREIEIVAPTTKRRCSFCFRRICTKRRRRRTSQAV